MTTRLQHSTTVIVPSTYGRNVAPASLVAQVRDYVARQLSVLYGGATVTDGRGFWVSSSDGRLVEEPVQLVTAYAEERPTTSAVEGICEYIRSNMDQESVSYLIDGAMYLT